MRIWLNNAIAKLIFHKLNRRRRTSSMSWNAGWIVMSISTRGIRMGLKWNRNRLSQKFSTVTNIFPSDMTKLETLALEMESTVKQTFKHIQASSPRTTNIHNNHWQMSNTLTPNSNQSQPRKRDKFHSISTATQISIKTMSLHWNLQSAKS